MNIAYLCNEDSASLVSPSPESPHYREESDCRVAIVGLRIAIKHYGNSIYSCNRRKQCYFDLLSHLMSQTLSRVEDFIQSGQQSLRTLCCQGYICGPHSALDQATLVPPPVRMNLIYTPTYTNQGLYWFKLRRADEEFSMTPVADSVILQEEL